MRFLIALVASGFLAASCASQAAESCLPNFTSLDVFQESSAQAFSHPLKSQNAKGPFVTRATLDGQWDATTLNIAFAFKFDGVSLPYNIYAILVVADGEVLAWHDLTRGCTGSGVSIFPGQGQKLPAIKIADGVRPNLHLIVWGRL